MTLILNAAGPIAYSPTLDKCIDFMWEWQRLMSRMRFEQWAGVRVQAYTKSYKSQLKRFSRGVQSSATDIFMEQLHEQLALDPGERNPLRPVWVNEQLDLVPTQGGADTP